MKTESNELFPVFLKLNQLSVLIVGGGNVALEKLTAILDNSPECKVTLLAIEFKDEIKKLATQFSGVDLISNKYHAFYLMHKQLVISAVNDASLAKRIKEEANEYGILCNSADKPELCDFYLGSIVQKGNLKIAISTNGKSPTIAKRIKAFLAAIIPNEIDTSLDRLQLIRNTIKGDFRAKVDHLNKITENLKYTSTHE